MDVRKIIPASWWTTGDMPVRTVSNLAFLIDGRMTMLEMCIGFLCAKRSIYITAFGLSPELLLVRGKQKSAGPPGSPEQAALLDWLRGKGLSEEVLLFWQDCEELSVANVLRHAVEKGVDVRVLLWDTYTLPFHPGPGDVQRNLEALGVCCVLDDSHKGLLNHPLEAHHQKTVVIDSRLAFVGGVDIMVNSNGEYDRWDTKGHPYHTQLRLDKNKKMPHSWHDTHVLFGGPAVADVELNFRQRWNAVIKLHMSDPALLLSDPATLRETASVRQRYFLRNSAKAAIQVIRTIPKGMYSFAADEDITTILQAYQRAFARAKRHIYLENQYLWQRTFLGFENPTLGLPNADMAGLLQTLAQALARGVVVTLVLPDNPNVGREFTDEGLEVLRKLAPQATSAGTLQVYMLGSSLQQLEQTAYRSIYVHAKTTIVDDTWVTLGSANLNNRGMHDDTELNIALLHPGLARRLRMLLMAEHLGLFPEEVLFQLLETFVKIPSQFQRQRRSSLSQWAHSRLTSLSVTSTTFLSGSVDESLREHWETLTSQLGDPIHATGLFAQQARANLQAVKAGQPITGHLLPYISHDLAKAYAVEVHAVNGWLDLLTDRPVKAEVSQGTE
jgi:phosphatidylserine/phosphatidylglycerophosphate/cardiolipin synthase-like enzyme